MSNLECAHVTIRDAAANDDLMAMLSPFLCRGHSQLGAVYVGAAFGPDDLRADGVKVSVNIASEHDGI